MRITGPDRVDTIGLPSYLNGVDGGEVGQRMLLALVNLELKVCPRHPRYHCATSGPTLPAVLDLGHPLPFLKDEL